MKRTSLRSLEKKADKLYQIRMIEQNPVSIISGEPTEVIHHFVPKSQSNNLRYDPLNGVPLTHKEHCRHHLSGDPRIVAGVIEKRGMDWYADLEKRRHIICKMNKGYLTEVINQLQK